MTIDRRGLLFSGAAAAVGLAGTRLAQAAPCASQPQCETAERAKAALRLSSQLGPIPAKELAEKLALMEK
jgi:hypothetical protein